MKRLLFLPMALLFACTVMAGDHKVMVVKTTPDVDSLSCATNIRGNLRFVTGVKRIEHSQAQGVVAITYDSELTDQKTIIASLKKIGYEATVISDKKKEKKAVDGTTGASQVKKN